MRKLTFILAIGLVVGAPLHGAVTSTIRMLSHEAELAPMGHSAFCVRYPVECEKTGSTKPVVTTPDLRAELDEINDSVNNTIRPKAEIGKSDQWLLNPESGDCEDYVVSKRHKLLGKGWPSSALLLAKVMLPDGGQHLVLLVRTSTEDFVLDNLKRDILTLAEAKSVYRWKSIESADNPKMWNRAANDG